MKIIAITSFLALIILQSFGEIIVLRHHPFSDKTTRVVTCISEDNDAALIWNYNSSLDSGKVVIEDFLPKNPTGTYRKYCAIWFWSSCVAFWGEKKGWGEVSSADRPMGPVFDYRWEGFKEFVFTKPIRNATYQYVRQVNNSSDTIVFSTRGSNDVYIFLCEKSMEKEGRCFWILLGSSNNTASGIRSCKKGAAPDPIRNTAPNDPCQDLTKHDLKNIIDEYEWRTFTIKLIKERKTIQVFKDVKNEPFLQGYLDEWHNVSHVLVRSQTETRVRFHFYQYFESLNKDAKISTSSFKLNVKNFCVQLLVGLCPKCGLTVTLMENEGRSMKNKTWIISGDERSSLNGMLAWRSVKLNASSLNFGSNSVKLEIGTILRRDEVQGRWAIGSIRMCQSVGVLRKSNITIQQSMSSGASIWPKINCQKLSYSNSTIVDSISSNTFDYNSKELEQFSRIRERLLGGKTLGPKSTLCSPTGCTCERGFKGNNCTEACSGGVYGYNCNETCGSCSDKSCDSVTGYCSKCRNKSLLPPLCKKVLREPTILQVKDDSVKILQKVEVELEEWIDVLFLRVQAKHASPQENGKWEELLYPTRAGGSLMYKIDIKNLKRNTMYMVHAVLHMKPTGELTRINSPMNYFATTCSGKQRFEVLPEEGKIKLIENSRAEECEDPQFGGYQVECRAIGGTSSNVIAVPSATLPHNIHGLIPNTEYELNVSGKIGNTLLWTTHIVTLQTDLPITAPGKVTALQVKYVSDTEVTLEWKAPSEKYQEINGYTVSIQEEVMFGCKLLRRDQPPKKEIKRYVTDTKVYIDGLHPYAKYKATVIAGTSTESESVEFETKEKYIPTSAVHQLNLTDKNRRLTWKDPEDCSTVSGKISAAVLFIAGVSEWAEDWTYREQTKGYSIDISSVPLMRYTKYKAQVHVIRALNQPENLTFYQEKIWRTEAAEPLAVGPLEVYDANIEENSISLRWGPPYPPRGEIESYHLTIYRNNAVYKNWTIKISEVRSTCEIWESFICSENVTLPSNLATDIEVKIYARNEGIQRDGVPKNLTFTPGEYNEAPAMPKILKEDFPGHGVVTFKWQHPFSPTYITLYEISVEYKDTRLQETPRTNFSSENFSVPVKKNLKSYEMKLPLAPSTTYRISIKSSNPRNSSAVESKMIRVPNGFGFPEGKKLEVEVTGNLTKVKVPGIVNATRTAFVRVELDGTFQCESFMQIRKLVDTYNESISNPRVLMMDANRVRLRNSSCSLVSGETYVVKVIVVDGTTSEIGVFVIDPSKELLVIGISCILSILVICFLIFCCRRWNTPSTVPRSQVQDRNSDIYTLPFESDSRVIRVEYFPEYAKMAATSGILLSQYMMFPRDLTRPCNYGRLPENMSKNRNENVIAYDDTRVVLDELPDEPYSDYINANYIRGYRGDKAYIATQGPMPNTINDFWRMVWQEKVYVICMLTNIAEDEKTKSEQYWPENGIKLKYGEVSVLVVDRQVFADYTVRIIRLGCQKYKRKITHLHYREWPSQRIPMYPQSLVAYLEKLEETPTGNGPIVVHCSTGAGRTGTLILCDICIHQANDEQVIDVLAVTTQMRASRANMVGTPQQYILAHVVIMESITATTRLFCAHDLPEQIKKLRTRLPEDVQRLNDREWQDRVLYSLVKPQHPTPGDFTRKSSPLLDSVCSEVIYFVRCSTVTSDSSIYIDAVSVDGAKTKKQFLASQLPSNSTWSKFWLIIAKKKIELIIILQRSDPRDPTYRDIMPGKSSFAPMPNMLIESKEDFREEDHFTSERFLLTNTSKNNRVTQPLTVLTCTGWDRDGNGNGKPPIPEALVSLWRASGKILSKESRTLVLCRDGVTGCGLYLALSFMLEKMAVDQECDVISAVRAVRRFRPEFVQPIEQFEYLYDAAIEYAKCFEIYNNFG